VGVVIVFAFGVLGYMRWALGSDKRLAVHGMGLHMEMERALLAAF
jgi:hypothetical protein